VLLLLLLLLLPQAFDGPAPETINGRQVQELQRVLHAVHCAVHPGMRAQRCQSD
jgi:hypothetical protein